MKSTAKTTFLNDMKYIWMITVSCLLLSACGYRFAGTGNLPSGIESVFIEILENRTRETNLGNRISNDLIYEFTRNKKDIQKDGKKADAVLAGAVASERTWTISRQGLQSPLERRVEITVNLTLTDPDEKVIWSASGISESETYHVETDKQATEQNRRLAIETLSKRLAENVYNRLTDNF
jgi:outer membrane lipopolysaccharide assembly protein LptE/RlpB